MHIDTAAIGSSHERAVDGVEVDDAYPGPFLRPLSHRKTHAGRVLVGLLCVAALASLAGCPELPNGWADTREGDGGDVFIPLTIVRVDDSVGLPTGGDRVTVHGSGFQKGIKVFFDGKAGEGPTILDDGRVNVTTPAHAVGLVDVDLELPDGQRERLERGFLYTSGLAVTSISPTEGPTSGGTAVTVVGKSFTRGTYVLVGGQRLIDTRRVDETTITGKTASRGADRGGRVAVIVSDGLEIAGIADAFVFTVPLELKGLEPVAGAARGGEPVVIRGEGLGSDCTARFGAQPAEFLDWEAAGGYLTVRTPAGAPGAVVDVVVTCAAAAETLAAAFFYRPEVVPAGLNLQHLFQAAGPRAGGTLVALVTLGMGSSDVKVFFGTSQATVLEVRRDTGIVVVESPSVSNAGEVAVTIVEGGRTSNVLSFEYQGNYAVQTVDPAFGAVEGGEVVLVFGKGLKTSDRVFFGSRQGDVESIFGDALRVQVPPGTAGRVDVSVIRNDGRTASVREAYEYRAGSTKVFGYWPLEGAQAGGRIVRVYGEGFVRGPPSLKFGVERASEVDVVDDGLAVVRVPAASVGRVNVDGGRPGFFAMGFRYFDPTRPSGGVGEGPIPEALNVTVIDRVTRKPVPDAFVILWDDLETPYQGLTDQRGQITFSEIMFGAPQMVTASRDDYTTATVAEFDARDVTLVLFPLTASPPGNGTPPTGGPQTRPDTRITGHVSGLDKYVVTPPGSCEARLGAAPGTLCQPCAADAECAGEGSLCVPLGDEGPRCATGCSTDVDCPEAFRCAGVTALGGPAVQCVPDAGIRTARCQLTESSVFSQTPAPSSPADGNMFYSIDSPPGEFAVVCLGGVEDRISGEFTPLVMGVRRNVSGVPGETIVGQDVPLDIPLRLDLRVRLDGAPTGLELTARHEADLFIDFGAEGVFRFPQRANGLDQNLFELKRFPTAFEDSLANSTFALFARAWADVPEELQTGEGSFVVQERIPQVFLRSLFEYQVLEDGVVSPKQLGSGNPINGMYAFAGAPGWLWAPGKKGQVFAFDGTVWGLQQTPVSAPLHGVWADSPSAAWAVGAEGSVVRWDGLRWARAGLPRALARVDVTWWGLLREADDVLWLYGDKGVWRWELNHPDGPNGLANRMDGDLTEGTITAMARDGAQRIWMVGLGGVIRRREASAQMTVLDRAGPALRAIHIISPDLIWASGDDGRMLRWDGRVWFELLPVGRRGLHGLAFVDAADGWAVGDAGDIWRWDGASWRPAFTIEHQDLRGVGVSGGRVFFAGLPTMVVGPFMQIPTSVNPSIDGTLTGTRLSWDVKPWIDPSFNWVTLNHPSQFTFWDVMAKGSRTDVPLPDLRAAWGIQALWPGENYIQMVRAYIPGFDMGYWDGSLFSVGRWQSWSVVAFPLVIPEE